MEGLENEVKGMRVLWLCTRANKSQLAMLLFSQGLLSKPEKGLFPIRPKITDPRTLSKRRKALKSLLTLMITSLASLILALCRTRFHSIPLGARRALRCVEEVCKTTCLIALGTCWDVIRGLVYVIIKWLKWRFQKT